MRERGLWFVVQDGLQLTTAFANEDVALQYIEELKAYDRWADGPWGLRQQQRDL